MKTSKCAKANMSENDLGIILTRNFGVSFNYFRGKLESGGRRIDFGEARDYGTQMSRDREVFTWEERESGAEPIQLFVTETIQATADETTD